MNHSCLTVTAALLLALQAMTPADAGCCGRCGATCPTQLVCHTICTNRLVEVTCWREQCETVCMPPKSASWAGCSDESACDACGQGSPLLSTWSLLFSPTSRCHFRDRSKLMRRTVVQYVPTLECVVEELCAGCGGAIAPSPLEGCAATQPVPAISLDAGTGSAPACAPGLTSGPVQFQVSDQLPEVSDPLPPVIPAAGSEAAASDELPALAPIVPVVHSYSR